MYATRSWAAGIHPCGKLKGDAGHTKSLGCVTVTLTEELPSHDSIVASILLHKHKQKSLQTYQANSQGILEGGGGTTPRFECSVKANNGETHIAPSPREIAKTGPNSTEKFLRSLRGIPFIRNFYKDMKCVIGIQISGSLVMAWMTPSCGSKVIPS
ncbi:hypothetical protein L211DRAFT_20309 [Terfezia boudieri ATCC MYA-4762]|uniref:Uncharacterized protein n=1 Tax=Terfezia boudieri ATCC MYA-4762 TaxID=1051890 RepID=A0A3N4M3A9_9PEZI|nr:hypothetical protein L211DRAFT_20309 [Terfezia boudieri ATCC MYA-4762]